MAAVTHDEVRARGRVASRSGLWWALISAASFGGSGSLGRGLIELGWSPAAAVLFRVLIAAVALTVPAVFALRGRWHLLRVDAGLVIAYGLIAVAGTQLAYFNAVQTMPVAMALLVEYVAPIAVVLFLWVRHGQRPTRLTTSGAVFAVAGLVLVLDLLSGASADGMGMFWAILAMAGAATYFVLSAQDTHLPPLVLAGAGLWIGAAAMALGCATGLMPYRTATGAVSFTVGDVPWWVALVALGLITAALAYVSGIFASRALGSRVASFVALIEVLFSLLFAMLLLDQRPGPVQVLGGLLILGGVVMVKLGEPVPELDPVVPDPT